MADRTTGEETTQAWWTAPIGDPAEGVILYSSGLTFVEVFDPDGEPYDPPRLRYGDGVTAVVVSVNDVRELARHARKLARKAGELESRRNRAAGADGGLRDGERAERLGQGLRVVRRSELPRDGQ